MLFSKYEQGVYAILISSYSWNTLSYVYTGCDRQRDWEHRRQFKFELKIDARHRLSPAVFFEEHQPQKLPIHGLYAGVVRDSRLPCKRYYRSASRAAACRAPVALLVASRVNVPSQLWLRVLRSRKSQRFFKKVMEKLLKVAWQMDALCHVICLIGFTSSLYYRNHNS